MRATKISFACDISGKLPPNSNTPLYEIIHLKDTTMILVKHEIIGESFQAIKGIIHQLPEQIIAAFKSYPFEITNLQFINDLVIQPTHFDLPKIIVHQEEVKIEKNHEQGKLVNLLLSEYRSGDIELEELVDCVISLDALGSENLAFLPGISTKRLAILHKQGIHSLTDFEKIGSKTNIQNIPKPTLENALAALQRYKEVIECDIGSTEAPSQQGQDVEENAIFANRLSETLENAVKDINDNLKIIALFCASSACDIIAATPDNHNLLELMGLASIGVGVWAIAREMNEKTDSGNFQYTWIQYQQANLAICEIAENNLILILITTDPTIQTYNAILQKCAIKIPQIFTHEEIQAISLKSKKFTSDFINKIRKSLLYNS